jgi:predicted O-methyltransferase YrrM
MGGSTQFMSLQRRPSKQNLVYLLLLLVIGQAIATLVFGTATGLIVAGSLLAAVVVLVLHVYFTLSLKLDEHARSLALDHVLSTRQVQSLLYLFSTLKLRRPLPPMRDMAISPDFAATLVSLVMELRPKAILEFGSGTSTLLCGYCLEALGAGRIISVDHEGKYAEQTRQSLREHGVDRFAEVIHAPLKELSLPAGRWKWYDTSFTDNLPAIDLLIVDGPPAWIQSLSRYPALPLIAKHLSASAVVLIDDADRPDEREMVRKWMADLPGFEQSDLLHEKGTVLLKRTVIGVRSGAGA